MPKGVYGRGGDNKRKTKEWKEVQGLMHVERNRRERERMEGVRSLSALTEQMMRLGARIEYLDEMKSVRAIRGGDVVWLRRVFDDEADYVISNGAAEAVLNRWKAV